MPSDAIGAAEAAEMANPSPAAATVPTIKDRIFAPLWFSSPALV
jgi:hypothetical protein